MKNKIGFIGLGLMGAPMCEHIQKAEFHLSVWNRTTLKCQPFLNKGAFLAANPQELAEESNIVIMCVTDEKAVDSILFGSSGVLMAKNKPIIIDHSTISPQKAREVARKVKEKGASYMDAPVTGSVPGAIEGKLLVFAAGES